MNRSYGLCFRRQIHQELLDCDSGAPDFLELAPENWMQIGGKWKRVLDQISERYPLTAHGLSMSLGSPDELNLDFVRSLKSFLDLYNIDLYSEHLSFSSIGNAHLFESLPIAFTNASLKHISEKIRIAQDVLERDIALENVCYYVLPESDMSEVEFLNRLVDESKCTLLLDVSNVLVNAANHSYSVNDFLDTLNFDSVSYVHIGSYEQRNDLIVDTHNVEISNETFELSRKVSGSLKAEIPILLERESNFHEPLSVFEELKVLKRRFDGEMV